MINEVSWTARIASEKARARRLVASGRAVISQTIHETYIGKRGLVNYEAWDVVELNSGSLQDRVGGDE